MTATIPAPIPSPGLPMDVRRPKDVAPDDGFARALERARPDDARADDERVHDRAAVRSRHAEPRATRRNQRAADRDEDRASHAEGPDVGPSKAGRPDAARADAPSEATVEAAASDTNADVVVTPLDLTVLPVAPELPAGALDLLQRVLGEATGAATIADDLTAHLASSALAATAAAAGTSASVTTLNLAAGIGGTDAAGTGESGDGPEPGGFGAAAPTSEAATIVPTTLTPTDPTDAADAAGERIDDLERAMHAEAAGQPATESDTNRSESPSRPTVTSPIATVEVAARVHDITNLTLLADTIEDAPMRSDVADDTIAPLRAAALAELPRRVDLPVSAAASTSTLASTRQPAPAEQVVNVLAPLRLRGDGNYEMRLELKPPELGRVEIRVEMRDGVLHAHLRAEQPAAAMALRDSLTQLRDHLAGHGVQAGTLDVDTNGAGGSRQGLDHASDPRDDRTDPRDRGPVGRDARSAGDSRDARDRSQRRSAIDQTNRLDVKA